ncbi:hypothetical protein MMC30_005390 [Trapelia coarctata]|nr:hypothetical protein [Trapelia coarctata]
MGANTSRFDGDQQRYADRKESELPEEDIEAQRVQVKDQTRKASAQFIKEIGERKVTYPELFIKGSKPHSQYFFHMDVSTKAINETCKDMDGSTLDFVESEIRDLIRSFVAVDMWKVYQSFLKAEVNHFLEQASGLDHSISEKGCMLSEDGRNCLFRIDYHFTHSLLPAGSFYKNMFLYAVCISAIDHTKVTPAVVEDIFEPLEDIFKPLGEEEYEEFQEQKKAVVEAVQKAAREGPVED